MNLVRCMRDNTKKNPDDVMMQSHDFLKTLIIRRIIV